MQVVFALLNKDIQYKSATQALLNNVFKPGSAYLYL